jgi:putative endonuclease
MDGREKITSSDGIGERLRNGLRRFLGRLTGWRPSPSGPGAKAIADKDRLGRRGERLALKYLKKQGYRCLARNYKAPGGEIDLIMRDGRTVVFVEVKTRRDESFTPSEEVINNRKRRHLETAAKRYIVAYRLHDFPCRFDTVAVVIPDDGPYTIRHQPSAFRPGR